MRSYQLRATILALACLTSAGLALAQNASTTPAAPAQEVPTPPADNPTFLDGLRRVGVMAGQVVECSADADKQNEISRAVELANLIAIHFGLKAAFTFSGALGYGSGRPFDKAACGPSDRGLETDPSQVPQQVRPPVMKKLLILRRSLRVDGRARIGCPVSWMGRDRGFRSCCWDGWRKGRASGAGAASWRWWRRR